MLSLFTFCLVLSLAPPAEPAAPTNPDFPVYVMKIPNPNDYTLFANGGWDGNWYVGYNTCWIKKLPPIPAGNFSRAYIGARLGRMKLGVNTRSLWDRRPVPGTIYMAISSTAAWKKDQSFLLTTTETIPLEGDAESAVEGTGESQWFWVEVPLSGINRKADNYLALWSPTPALVDISSSPVLAAAWGGKEQDTWLTRDISGSPPRQPAPSLGTPISYFQPALGLKLIPAAAAHPMNVQIVNWNNGEGGEHSKPSVGARVAGDSIQSVWLEYSLDRPADRDASAAASAKQTWSPLGRPLWKAPYILPVDQSKFPPGRAQLRVAAANIWEERAASPPFSVDVSTLAKHQP